MRAKWAVSLTAFVVVAGALAPRGAPPARADGPASPRFVIGVNVTGSVNATDAAGFTIDDVRFVWPTAEEASLSDAECDSEIERPPVAVGDAVHVLGFLQTDGVVVVGSDYPVSTQDIRSLEALRFRYGAGLVEAFGADSITVAGSLHRVMNAPSLHFSTGFWFAGGMGWLSELRVGDTVLFNDIASPAADGEDVLGWVTVLSNGEGDAVSITGPVTRDHATYEANEPGDFSGVAGARIDVDGTTCFATADRASAFAVATGPLVEGDTVKVDGRFRDGVLLVESVEVLAWADGTKAARRAAIGRRVRVRGVVTNADPLGFAVDGIRIELPARIERSLRRRPLRVGDRVDVKGRGVAGGHVAAASLRRN